jgi:hypothetical protein
MKTEYVKNMIFNVIILFAFLFLVLKANEVHAEREEIWVTVIASEPYYGENQDYVRKCFKNFGCKMEGVPAEFYATTFTNGRVQFTILTKAHFANSVWFDVVRDCATEERDECEYLSAKMSRYQSVETLAINEILTNEQRKYLLNPRRMY